MAIDLTGGLTDDREFVFAEQPADPDMRESVNTWVWDGGTDFGMPRIGVEAVGDQWETHDVQVNVAFADGRVFNIFGPGKVHDPRGADGKPRILGAGPLSFELVEPFRHWRGRVDGTAVQTSTAAQMEGWQAGRSTGERVPIEIDWDIRSAVPPWESGTLLEEARYVLAHQEEGDLMGGPRFEQLFRTTGTLRVGDEEHRLDGAGLRIRRTGIRRLATFRGHVWQSTVFPSGRAFGLCVYPPRDDGKPTFNEGFLFEGDGALIPARVVDAPWLTSLAASGQDVSVTLETDDGRTATIQGETALSTFHVMNASAGATGMVGDFRLQQAIVRYTWDGESATGMLERSSADSQVGWAAPRAAMSRFGHDTTAAEVARTAELRGRRAVVTGASSGIGVETARALAGAGADVVLAVRDVQKGEAVACSLTPGARGALHVARLDLREVASVVAFADRLTRPVDLLIANAGVSMTPDSHLPNGLDVRFATNHLGHFLLAVRLREQMARNGARLVVVSSAAHKGAPVRLDDLQWRSRPHVAGMAYAESKSANILFAEEATRRWATDGIYANAVLPGFRVLTGLQRFHGDELKRRIGFIRADGTPDPILKTAAEAAATTVWAATAPELEGRGGLVLEDCAEALPVGPDTHPWSGFDTGVADAETARRLWERSIDLLGALGIDA